MLCSRRGRKWLRVMVSQRILDERQGGVCGRRLWQVGRMGAGLQFRFGFIFLHDCPMDVMTNGEREIDGRQFYLRPRSALSAFPFSTRTSSGIL